MNPDGSAYLDSSGRVLAADATFLALLGLPQGDPTEALRQRAVAEPALAALISGEGPDAIELASDGQAPGCEVSRVASEHGVLLRARPGGGALPAPVLELAMQALALSRLAGTVAHEVKNPLNAMALQLALLGDKISTADETLASACAGNLGSLKNQIGRIDELVRRYIDVADPAPATGFDAGTLLADMASLFGHEARRQRIALVCEPGPGSLHAAGDPVRVSRLLLGLLSRAIAGTPPEGRLLVRAVSSGTEAALTLEHPDGALDPTLAWVGGVVAAGAREMSGRLEESRRDGIVRATLVLPKERLL